MEIETLYYRMIEMLGRGVGGVHPWLVEVVGENKAEELARQGGIPHE
jgi:hypothetical protein